MAKGLVIHIEDSHDQRVEVWTDEHLRVGVTADCDVRLRDADWEAAGVVLELARRNSRFRVASVTARGEVTYRQQSLRAGDVIDDGGAVRVGQSSLSVRFLPFNPAQTSLVATGKTAVAPFIEEAALGAAASPQRSDAIFFVRELGRELWRELGFKIKLALIGGPLVLLLAGAVLGLAIYRERRRSLDTISRQTQQLKDQDYQIKEMERQMGDAGKRLDDLDKSRKDLQSDLRERLSWKERTAHDYQRGVCLIYGVYQLLDPDTGRTLRYPESTLSEEGETVTGVGAPPLLSSDGKGQLAEYPFIGTGFHVGNGYVVTNRHIAQPWTSSEGSPLPGNPRLKFLKAYFPGQRGSLALQVKTTAKDDDVAVCFTGNRPAETPALPLGTETPPVVGAEVMVMGYPSGPDRILSTLKPKDAENLQRRYGGSLDALLNRLAELSAIRPLNTFGNITDSYKDRVIYDAITSEGGSGGPIFNAQGRVIGISFGVFTGNSGSNFGVPAANALNLLQKAGWQQPAAQSSPTISPTP